MAKLGNMYFGTHGNAKKHLVTCSDLIVDVMQLKGVFFLYTDLSYIHMYITTNTLDIHIHIHS